MLKKCDFPAPPPSKRPVQEPRWKPSGRAWKATTAQTREGCLWGWGHGTGDHTDTRAPQLWPGAPGALVCIGKELCLQVPRPWHFSPNRPGKARADKAPERNSLENTENEVTVSSGCSDRKVGLPHSFSSYLQIQKQELLWNTNYLGHILISFGIHFRGHALCQPWRIPR